MKTTVEISDPLLKDARALAVKEGVTVGDLVQEGLRFVIASRKNTQAEPFKLRDGSFKGGTGLQAGLSWTDLTAFGHER